MSRVVKPGTDRSVATKLTDKKMNGSSLKSESSSTEKSLVEKVSASSKQTYLPVAEEEKPQVEYAFNWAKKYQPKALNDFICYREKVETLQNLVHADGINHCIFEGPPGVGKRTLALAMLRELGLGITETREEVKEFKLNASKDGPISSTYIKVKISSQHIEINLSELKWHVKDIVMELIKEIYANEHSSGHSSGRALIVNEADRLPMDAQLHVRSFLENCRGHYKVVFCCYDIVRLEHLSPLCIIIQLLPPSDGEIVDILNFIAKQEDIELPYQLAKNIAEKSKHCLQQAIRSFEATWQTSYPFKEDQPVVTGWEEELASIAKSIIEEQSPKRLFIFRQKLQILFEHNLCSEFVFGTLVEELKRHLDEQIQLQLGNLYQNYNADNGGFCIGAKTLRNTDQALCEQMRKRVYKFMRIEEFVAKFMSLYKYTGIKEG